MASINPENNSMTVALKNLLAHTQLALTRALEPSRKKDEELFRSIYNIKKWLQSFDLILERNPDAMTPEEKSYLITAKNQCQSAERIVLSSELGVLQNTVYNLKFRIEAADPSDQTTQNNLRSDAEQRRQELVNSMSTNPLGFQSEDFEQFKNDVQELNRELLSFAAQYLGPAPIKIIYEKNDLPADIRQYAEELRQKKLKQVATSPVDYSDALKQLQNNTLRDYLTKLFQQNSYYLSCYTNDDIQKTVRVINAYFAEKSAENISLQSLLSTLHNADAKFVPLLSDIFDKAIQEEIAKKLDGQIDTQKTLLAKISLELEQQARALQSIQAEKDKQPLFLQNFGDPDRMSQEIERWSAYAQSAMNQLSPIFANLREQQSSLSAIEIALLGNLSDQAYLRLRAPNSAQSNTKTAEVLQLRSELLRQIQRLESQRQQLLEHANLLNLDISKPLGTITPKRLTPQVDAYTENLGLGLTSEASSHAYWELQGASEAKHPTPNNDTLTQENGSHPPSIRQTLLNYLAKTPQR